jgi:hypothetical protein
MVTSFTGIYLEFTTFTFRWIRINCGALFFAGHTRVPGKELGVPAEVSDPCEQVKPGIDHDIRAEYRRVNRRVRASSIHRREETRSVA